MSEQLSVSRELFDQVMVPNYAPSAVIPVRGQGSRVWDQEIKNISTLPVVLPLTV